MGTVQTDNFPGVEEVLLPLPGGDRGSCKSVSWYFGGQETTQKRRSCLIFVMRQLLYNGKSNLNKEIKMHHDQDKPVIA